MELVHKEATATVDPKTLEYIMSDATVDRYGDVVDPRGWDLEDFRRNPIALWGHNSKDPPIGRWADLRVEGSALKGRLELAASGTSARIDEIRSLAQQGILKGVSVGFVPLEAEPLPGGKGRRFKRSKLVECSLVSIPANPSALQVMRSLGVSTEIKAEVLGELAERNSGFVNRNGEFASTKSFSSIGIKMEPVSLSKRIEDTQSEIVKLRDALTEFTTKSGDLDEGDIAAMEELNSAIERKENTLKAFQSAEQRLALKSEPAVVQRSHQTAAIQSPAIKRPLGIPVKEVRPADHVIRSAAVHAVAHTTGRDPDTVLQKMYPDDEATHLITRAAVAGATTTTSGWAAELVNTVMVDFLETLRPASVYPALRNAGVGLNFGPNAGAIKIPSRSSTPSISGSFVGEGSPIPVRRLGLTSLTLTPKKMGVISVFSREIARYGTPAIEALIRGEIIADTAATLDSLLLDATAGSAVRPAGLLNGVSALTATAGGGYAAILGDIKKIVAPFDAANMGRNIFLIMHPAQARSLALTPGADGTLGWANDTLGEFTIVVSTGATLARVIAVDAADFVSAVGDAPEFELADTPTLHMEDTTPLQIGTAGAPATVAAPTQSMFQTAQLALRMLMDVTWGVRRTGIVQYVDTVTW